MKPHYSINFCKPLLGLACSFLLLLQACVEDPEMKRTFEETETPLVENIRTDPSLSLAVQALEKTNMANTLNTYGPYTFFAPDNQAFEKYFQQIGVSGLDEIDVDQLRTILQYHILKTRVRAKDFVQGTIPDSTVNGDYLKLDISGGLTTGAIINEKAKVYATNIESSNGVVHKIDAVVDPPVNTIAGYLMETPELSILKAGMERAGLMDTLSTMRSLNPRRPYTLKSPMKLKTQLTLFAETNDVFEAAGITMQTIMNMPLTELKRLMRYHIVPENQYTYSIVPTTNFESLGIPGNGYLDAMNLQTLSPNDYINYDKLQANKINQTINIKPTGKDIFVKNGVIQYIDKPLRIFDIGMARRIPIVHEAESRWYAFGAPVNSNSPRVFGPEKASNARPREYFTFMKADSKDDSLVLIVPGIQKGKYKITLNYKKGGNRAEVQPVIGGKTKSPDGKNLNKIYLRNGSTNYEQKAVISNSFEFKTSGTKRITFVTTGRDNRWEIPLDAIVLTPVK